MIADPQFWTVSEFAEIMRLSKPTIYRIIDSGKIKVVHIGGTIRIPQQIIVKYLEQCGLTEYLQEAGLASTGKPLKRDPDTEVRDAILTLATHLPDLLSRQHKAMVSLITVWSDGTTTALQVPRDKVLSERQQNGKNPGGALAVPFIPPRL